MHLPTIFLTQIAFQLHFKPFIICALQLPLIWEFQLLVFRRGLMHKMFVSCWFQMYIPNHGDISNESLTYIHDIMYLSSIILCPSLPGTASTLNISRLVTSEKCTCSVSAVLEWLTTLLMILFSSPEHNMGSFWGGLVSVMHLQQFLKTSPPKLLGQFGRNVALKSVHRICFHQKLNGNKMEFLKQFFRKFLLEPLV